MRRWARLLLVPAIAPATVLMTVAAAPYAAAHASSLAPAAYIVCLDPGHGGAPDNNDPSRSYDPGALGLDGLVEKELTLDVSLRLRQLLEADKVKVVMTRADDRDVSIEQRSAISNAAGANLFVSIHFNTYTDPSVGGSLVLYPGTNDIDFARVMDQRLAANLEAYGVGNGGIQLRDDWWIHVQAPVATLESAYITNQHEADLLSQPGFRQVLAGAMKDGIETYLPDILHRKQQILAAAGGGGAPAAAGPAVAAVAPEVTPLAGQLIRGLVAVVAVLLGVRHRRRLWWLLTVLGRGVVFAFRHSGVHRRAQRRRRRLVRERTMAARTARLGRVHSVYDELFL